MIPIYYFPTIQQALAPLSAGTEYKVCVWCCACSASPNESLFKVVPPHPIWTNERGKDVMLLDAIVLGGPNGLNA